MTIESSTLTSSFSNGISTATATSINKLSDNYDMFISILTTQLKNQNPLDPTDTDELTQQLLSYSQVEQQILTNQYMENLVLATNNQTAQTALSFVGMEITYDSSRQDLSGDSLSWAVDIPKDAASVTYEVKNKDGLTVYQRTNDAPESGDYTFTWNGSSTDNSVTDGDAYTLVATVTYRDGKTEKLDLEANSAVTEVDWSSGAPVLMLANGSKTSLDRIISARPPRTTDA